MTSIRDDAEPPRMRIGARLRALRLERQLTIEQVADRAGLTKSFLSRIERDLTSPSVQSLVTICEVLDASVGDLFASTDAHIVRADDSDEVEFPGTLIVDKLVSPRHNKKFQVLRSSIAPGGNGGDELYIVNAEVELIYVLSGTLIVRFSDSEHILNEGDTITFYGREPHQWRSETGADLIWVLVPAAWKGSEYR